MSFPSITAVLARHGITDLAAADQSMLDGALLEAHAVDLPLGVAYLAELAKLVKTSGARVLQIEDPSSPLGQQLIRLLGTDVSRGVQERTLGVAFGLYNCCAPVCALTHDELAMTAVEQINLQNGVLAAADC